MTSHSRKKSRKRSLARTSSPGVAYGYGDHYYGRGPAQEPQLEPYQYTELEHPQSVRLLEVILLPGATLWSSNELKCRIRHCSLDDQPLYTAVSYTWGSEQTLCDLNVEGKVLRVRTNVFNMLRRLARRDQWRTLWVDTICINQSDLLERNAQVRLMGNIFAKANFVLSWLDDNRTYAQSADVTMSSLSMVATIVNQGKQFLQYSEANLRNMIDHFFLHPYWERRWVIQEVALARSVLIVSPGWSGKLDQLPLSYIDSFYQQFRQATHLSSSDRNNILKSPVKHFLASRLKQRTGFESLTKLLTTYKDNRCSDVRDKVFALVSLSDTAKDHLEINYAAPPVTILFSVLRYAFAHESLSQDSVVGLLFQLKKQLLIKRTELLQAYSTYQYEDVIRQLALIAVYNQGYVSEDIVEPRDEACAYKCRESVYAIRGLQTSLLRTYEQADGINVMKFAESTRDLLNEIPMSGQDLCVFTFTQSTSDSTQKKSRMGLASSWVQPNDEIWQFLGTPVAMIARREHEAYRIVARALIIKPAAQIEHLTEYKPPNYFTTYGNYSSDSPSFIYDWSKFTDQGSFLQGNQPTHLEKKPILVSFGMLLDILEWVDSDQISPKSQFSYLPLSPPSSF